jgi:hypothetical protein
VGARRVHLGDAAVTATYFHERDEPTTHLKPGISVRPVPSSTPAHEALFGMYVSVDPSSGCWLWTGRRDRDGQPRFKMHQVIYGARRVALAWALEDDLSTVEIVRPSCGTCLCVRPDHMDWSLPRVLHPLAIHLDRKRSGAA